MRRASVLALILLFAGFSLESVDQAGKPAQSGAVGDQHLPPAVKLRPRLSLQEALKIAENYVRQEHIDMSSYWLYRAIYVVLGDESTPPEKRLPGWHFWWVSDTGAAGDYVEIFVTLNGQANRMPSM